MDENEGSKDGSASKAAKSTPEVTPPAASEKSARPRKEPPVLEGEAEVISEKTTSRPRADAPAAESVAAKATMPSSSRSGLSLVLVALLAGAAGAAAVGAAGYVLGYGRVSLETQDKAIAALETRLSALDAKSDTNLHSLQERTLLLAKRLEATEAQLTAQAQSPENIAALKTQLDTLTSNVATLTKSIEDLTKGNIDAHARLANLETTLTALNTALSALSPRLDETVARVITLEEKAKDPDAAGRAVLGLALANLTRASEGAGPFKTELDAIASFLPDEPELAKLEPVAAKGVSSLASLKERFPVMVQSVFDAERQAGAQSLWSKFWGNAKSLVTIRRTGEISGSDTEAVIARMEARLKIDDLAAALREAKLLKGPAANAAKPWITQAQARLNIDMLVRSLSARVTSRLAKG